MRCISEHEFLRWVGDLRIGINPQFKDDWPRNLCFLDHVVESRCWLTPREICERTWFLEELVFNMGEWERLLLWPKGADLIDEFAGGDDPLERFLVSQVKPIWQPGCAVQFARSELDCALAVMLCSATFGWSAPNDLYVVPDTCDMFLMVDHHDVVWAEFATAVRCHQYVDALAKEGIVLPTEPPDWTFKTASWMSSGSGSTPSAETGG